MARTKPIGRIFAKEMMSTGLVARSTVRQRLAIPRLALVLEPAITLHATKTKSARPTTTAVKLELAAMAFALISNLWCACLRIAVVLRARVTHRQVYVLPLFPNLAKMVIFVLEISATR